MSHVTHSVPGLPMIIYCWHYKLQNIHTFPAKGTPPIKLHTFHYIFDHTKLPSPESPFCGGSMPLGIFWNCSDSVDLIGLALPKLYLN